MPVNDKKLTKRQAPPVPAPRCSKSEADVDVEQKSAEMRLTRMEEEVDLKKKCNVTTETREIGEVSPSSQDLESIKRELQDVIQKNTQWQIYDSQREQYVKELIHRYNELHQRYHHLHQTYTMLSNDPNKLPDDQQRQYFDDLLTKAQKELETSREEAANAKSELHNAKSEFAGERKKLQHEIDHWRARYEQEKEVTAKLRYNQAKFAKHKHTSNNANKENADRIVSLQREMEEYREDFHCERKKREDLERRLDGIQKSIKDAGRPIQVQKPRKHHSSSGTNALQNLYLKERRYVDTVSPPKLKKAIEEDEALPKLHKERRSHPDPVHVTTRVRRVKESRNKELIEDSLHASDRMNRTYHEFGRSNDSNLFCPNCGKTYGVDEHEFLLSHIDSCI